MVNRLCVRILGSLAIADERSTARLDAECPVRAARLGRLGEPVDGVDCQLKLIAARRGFD
jgi:hypothetical protein